MEFPTSRLVKPTATNIKRLRAVAHPGPMPQCSRCGGVASSDPCVSCRPTDAADTERGAAFSWFAIVGTMLAFAGVLWCVKC